MHLRKANEKQFKMRQFILVGLLLLGTHMVASAQVDDIYATGADQRNGGRGKNETGQAGISGDESAANQHENYADNNAPDNYQSYNNGEDYIDYDEDYSYSSRINRFDNSFYNMGYYSAFYNPFWYDPYWSDPYWGYRPWYASYGYSYGPYWNSGWGWNTWYGYGGFSCWNYPYYAGGWYGNCYNGYWNSYYAGVDGRNNQNRSVGYGPRQNSIGNRMGNRITTNGFRTSAPVNQIGLRTNALRTTEPNRAGVIRNGNNGRNNLPDSRRGKSEPRMGGRFNGNEGNYRENNSSRGYSGGGNRNQERVSQNEGRQGRESSRGQAHEFGNSNGPTRMFGGNNGGSNGSRVFNGGGNSEGRSFNGGGGNNGGRSFNGGGGNSGGRSNGGGGNSQPSGGGGRSSGGGGSRSGRR